LDDEDDDDDNDDDAGGRGDDCGFCSVHLWFIVGVYKFRVCSGV
jgi:hypothetical protein